MVCPHCEVAVHESWKDQGARKAGHITYGLQGMNCPDCGQVIFQLRFYKQDSGSPTHRVNFKNEIIYPPRRPPKVSDEVPDEYAEDYREAALVLRDSPKASAALSRRIVQHVIREKAGITKRNLSDEIDALIDTDTLPGDLANDLDALRTVGNFAAHPIKSTNTGEVVEVEEGEAEWLLNLLDELFEFYFVRPARRAAQRAQLNAKLADAGKPPLKGSP